MLYATVLFFALRHLLLFEHACLLISTHVQETCKDYFVPLTTLPVASQKKLREVGMLGTTGEVRLMREMHVAYIRKGMSGLSSGYVSLDASRPWLVYWMVHALDLLDSMPEVPLLLRCIDTLSRCQNTTEHTSSTRTITGEIGARKGMAGLSIGGFCGGPQQMPHCAPTYAGVLALLSIGGTPGIREGPVITHENNNNKNSSENNSDGTTTAGTPAGTGNKAYDVIDRAALYRFFLAMKDESGGFTMHDSGEVDVRGTYTVIAIAHLCNILTPELARGVVEYR